MTEVEEARAKHLASWDALKLAVDVYFDARRTADNLEHDAECDDVLCEAKEQRAQWGQESLSTMVVLAEYTSITTAEHTATATVRAHHGSPMAVLGLVSETFLSWRA